MPQPRQQEQERDALSVCTRRGQVQAIEGSLSSNMWLDFAIMSIEQLLNVLHTIRTAYREPAIVGRDASTAAAVAPNGENGHIESEAVPV